MIKIAIWGAGRFGQFILEQIKNNLLYNVVFIIDSNEDKNFVKEKKFALNKEIISPECFYHKRWEEVDFVLVAILNSVKLFPQLKKSKVKFGYVKNCVYLRHLMLEENLTKDTYILWEDSIPLVLDKVYMNHLQCNIVDNCNLNCKGCSHFANLFDEESIYPLEEFRRDIEKIAAKLYLEEMVLVGGEPFLNENIIDYVECIRLFMEYTTVMIVSNGLLIPQLEKTVLKKLAEYEVRIIITEYPPVSKIKNSIQKILNEYGIIYTFTQQVKDFGKNLDLSGKNDPFYAQRHCRQYLCQFLRNGKIYKCPFAALHGIFFDYYGIAGQMDTGLDLDRQINWKAALERLYEEPVKLCQYCGKEKRFGWECHKKISKEDWLI